MERSMAVAPEDLRAFVASLVNALRRWDPQHNGPETPLHQQLKQDFIDALTEISALPSDSLDMEVRRLVVDNDDHDAQHLRHLVSALSHRDVLLKCKVANAIGSLCTSRVAGQRLLELHGETMLPPLIRMVTSKNIWAQADALFVFGWIVVIGEDALVHQHLERYISLAIRLLLRSLTKQQAARDPLEEQDANLRVYALVFLLNFSQKHAKALEQDLPVLLEMLQLLVSRLLQETASIWAAHSKNEEDWRERFTEHVEFVRLAVTLLGAVVAEIEAAPAMIISLKMLPALLKLDQTLHSDELRNVWRIVYEEDADEADGDQEDSVPDDHGVLQELQERVRVINETVLASR